MSTSIWVEPTDLEDDLTIPPGCLCRCPAAAVEGGGGGGAARGEGEEDAKGAAGVTTEEGDRGGEEGREPAAARAGEEAHAPVPVGELEGRGEGAAHTTSKARGKFRSGFPLVMDKKKASTTLTSRSWTSAPVAASPRKLFYRFLPTCRTSPYLYK